MNTVTLNNRFHKIGSILKAYREKSGQFQSVIAKNAGISTSMLSQIERSVVLPSIETLFDVCEALGLDISALFNSITKKKQVRLIHNRERLKTARNGIYYEQLMINIDSPYQSEMFLLEIDSEKEVGMSTQGHTGFEMGYVLSGSATLTVNNVEYHLQAGDSVSFDSSQPHKMRNTGKTKFRAVWNTLPPHKDYLEIDE
ncbi:MAG: cupin domain-containing protein [Chitinispirillia bacterium]|jgi:transcriptional regulator with XRE-family HTH domain